MGFRAADRESDYEKFVYTIFTKYRGTYLKIYFAKRWSKNEKSDKGCRVVLPVRDVFLDNHAKKVC